MFKLRDYQQLAVDRTNEHLFTRGYGGTLIVLATGLGKTAFAWGSVVQLMDLSKQRVMFVVNTQDLVHQAVGAFRAQYPQIAESRFTPFSRPAIGRVMNSHNDVEARIIVGTPQTLSSTVKGVMNDRLKEVLKYGDIDLIIIDEAHYAAAASYINLFNQLPNAKRLGLTATPMRADGLGLQQKLENGAFTFDSLPIQYGIKWGIENGYLCPIRMPILIQTDVQMNANYKGGENGDDFTEDDFVKALDIGNWCEVIEKGYAEYGEGRPGVAFMPSVDHSKEFCRYMQELGYSIAHVDGAMCIDQHGKEVKSSERQKIYEDYREGKIQLLTNFNVLTTGWDAPRTAIVIMARPTKNAGLYTQMIGRGTRIKPKHEKYSDLAILDFALKGIKLINAGTLFGNEIVEAKPKLPDEVEIEELTEEQEDAWDTINEDIIIDGVGLKIRAGKLFDEGKDAWYRDSNAASLSLDMNGNSLMITNQYPNIANNIQTGINNGRDFLDKNTPEHPKYDNAVKQLNILEETLPMFSKHCLFKVSKDSVELLETEDSVPDMLALASEIVADEGDPNTVKKNSSWRKRSKVTPPTEKQLEMLKRFQGIHTLDGLTKEEASKLISHLISYSNVKRYLNNRLKRCGKYGGEI